MKKKDKTTIGAQGLLALTGLAASADAATVQITTSESRTNVGGFHLTIFDLTGDGIRDGAFKEKTQVNSSSQGRRTSAAMRVSVADLEANFNYSASINRNVYTRTNTTYYGGTSTSTSAFTSTNVFGNEFGLESRGAEDKGPTAMTKRVLARILFTDSRINGGALTTGWVDATLTNNSRTSHTISISRLIFDDASASQPVADINTTYSEFVAVPEPSSLALLALGAGGIITRRRRKAA